MPTVTVDGKTQKFQADKAGGYQPITEGGVTYSLVKDKDSGRYTMNIRGEPAALEKYNFSVGKGRVTNANFGKGDSMENFFKGSVSVGEKKKADKDYFQNFSIAGGHLADKASFLQSGAWGLDANSAHKELERLEEEAKKAKEAEDAKKTSGTQEAGEQKPVVKTGEPPKEVSDPANTSSIGTSQEPENAGPPRKVEIKGVTKIELDDFSDDVVGEEQLEANLKALESGDTEEINFPGIGLPNGANNCFQNAALAALRGMGVQSTAENAPRLQNYLDGKVTTHGQALALREEVAQKMELPNEIKNTISKGSYLVQHDAVEVLEALLDKSNMPEVVVVNKTEHTPSNGGSIFSKTGEEKSKILKLPVPADSEEIPMQKLIQSFSQLSFVNDVQFESLKNNVSAERTSTLKNAPEKLAVQIGRMNLGDSGQTVRRDIEVPDVMNKITLQVDGQSMEYQPTGIIVHVPGKEDPTNANSGHYIYYENMDGGNIWREINDEKVTYFNISKGPDLKNSIQKNCYLVTYQKVTIGEDGQLKKPKVKLPFLPQF